MTKTTPAEAPKQPETFGHEPVTGTSIFGLAETVCARCTERGVWFGTVTELLPVHILWPCTSALVLGLASVADRHRPSPGCCPVAPPRVECGWNPMTAAPDCDHDPTCPVHGQNSQK
ncbi:hypothetical protein ACFW9I_02665 [[Kitasatospora] papulosa]|uniref:hypothetical protein n=1 Tax=[Kitasatospora] papulosa TaxID=1464011 RepID=UPI003675ACAF